LLLCLQVNQQDHHALPHVCTPGVSFQFYSYMAALLQCSLFSAGGASCVATERLTLRRAGLEVCSCPTFTLPGPVLHGTMDCYSRITWLRSAHSFTLNLKKISTNSFNQINSADSVVGQ
jgi:hypothetical protein